MLQFIAWAYLMIAWATSVMVTIQFHNRLFPDGPIFWRHRKWMLVMTASLMLSGMLWPRTIWILVRDSHETGK